MNTVVTDPGETVIVADAVPYKGGRARNITADKRSGARDVAAHKGGGTRDTTAHQRIAN
jgi:hypothetical protein